MMAHQIMPKTMQDTTQVMDLLHNTLLDLHLNSQDILEQDMVKIITNNLHLCQECL